jgi:hypothetical protein
VRSQIYSSAKLEKQIAADMDLSQSELTRKIGDNPNDQRNFSVDDLERYIETQKDLTPIYYLIEKFGVPEDIRRAQAEAALQRLLPELQAIAAQFAPAISGKRRR